MAWALCPPDEITRAEPASPNNALMLFWPPMSRTATGEMLCILTYTANINIAINGWPTNPEILAHYRSVEEQFYLVWPLVVVLYGSRLFLMRACIAMGVFAKCRRIVLAISRVRQG